MAMERTLLLQVTLLCSVLFASYVEAQYPGCEKESTLPSNVCYWSQGTLVGKIPPGPCKPDCEFVIRQPEFLKVIGSSPKVRVLVRTPALEGGVYYPDKDEFYFSTVRFNESQFKQPSIDVKKVNLRTRQITSILKNNPPLGPLQALPCGMALDNNGHLIVAFQGSNIIPGSIKKYNLSSTAEDKLIKNMADNWFSMPFNSPNDVVVKSDGSIWFTDPSYARAQGLKTTSSVKNMVYKIGLDGFVDVVANGFSQPNGLAFSPDEKRLYVTDTGYDTGRPGEFDIMQPHTVIVFDVGRDGLLGNRRLFASVGTYINFGGELDIPNGIKVDTNGRVYVASRDGVQIFSRSGRPLGLIKLLGASNIGFGGKKLDTLYMLDGKSISYIKLQAKGAGLKYATKSSF
ncbi:lactonohydrolase oryL [Physcomitrium patens]|uniref:SMP-30/Gluconolactonase/LRE-like region domain-containing protein n=1 Tax=Physcomitrium patens TaxID=3218 RepID=A0A2K1KJ77_PHYPA|nr:uncharacterized protein LOC112282284 [Physcomitrium patens]PNR53836.1 hypothetical protein PHYPA_007511 [Physcomitrium patens]|eukprot:XP_024375484.1 uncharacterized protein LOC112282284 [Physcomitrella patens]